MTVNYSSHSNIDKQILHKICRGKQKQQQQATKEAPVHCAVRKHIIDDKTQI